MRVQLGASHTMSGVRIISGAATFALGWPPAIAGASSGGEWQPLAPMQVARQETAAARVGDTVYVLGGLVAGSLTPTDVAEAYHVPSNTWSEVAPMPVGLHHTTCAVLDGEIHVTGGYRSGFVPRAEVYIYDPTENEWRDGTPLPEPRGAGWMVAHGGRLYHFGGVGPIGTTATTYAFDPLAGWSEVAPMPTPREHLNAAVVGAYVYVIGGRAGPSTDANERYDPVANTWLPRAALPTARSAMAMAPFDGRIYCSGGEVPQLFGVTELYDPVANAWNCAESMPIPRHGVAAVTLDDRILVPAGGVVQGLDPTNIVDSFVPEALVPVADPTVDSVPAPVALRLLPPRPNPFSAHTRLRLALARDVRVTLSIHDVTGRLVRTLIEGTVRPGAGVYDVTWDGRDARGHALGSGRYYARCRASGRLTTTSLSLLR